jgi:hypothetical protein
MNWLTSVIQTLDPVKAVLFWQYSGNSQRELLLWNSMNLAILWKLSPSIRFFSFAAVACNALWAGELSFTHHYISRELPLNSGAGDYGLTALVDLDKDGDLDFVLGGRQPSPSRLYWFEYEGPDQWIEHLAGTNYFSDVGLAPLDVDGDGWTDLVCSGVWYRNSGKPKNEPFTRHLFAEKSEGAHDILVADIDANGKNDIVMMGDARTALNALRWYEIPEEPTKVWKAHQIGTPVHGAITPAGIGDLDGDGDLDIVRADCWFENADGKGLTWREHKNIPMGRSGPFGVCVRAVVKDMDGDGRNDIVMCDADIEASKMVVLWNRDGKGQEWLKQELPQSFKYGSLHALALADFDKDGLADIISNEQEELLPNGRENPRWVIWHNLGKGQFAETIVLDAKLGGHELQVGDVDGDGDIDICSKAWGPRPWNGNGVKMHVDFLENRLKK